MIKIRTNTFETNSSSTHSIAIPKEYSTKFPNHVDFKFDEFGWEFEQVNPANYLYTAIYVYTSKSYASEKIKQLKSILDKNNITYTMQSPKYMKYSFNGKMYYYITDGNIDHSENLGKFLDNVFSSDESLLNFIFYGLVFTGNDNCKIEESNFVNRCNPTYVKSVYDDNYKLIETVTLSNPYYDKIYENFDWYKKGN